MQFDFNVDPSLKKKRIKKSIKSIAAIKVEYGLANSHDISSFVAFLLNSCQDVRKSVSRFEYLKKSFLIVPIHLLISNYSFRNRVNQLS